VPMHVRIVLSALLIGAFASPIATVAQTAPATTEDPGTSPDALRRRADWKPLSIDELIARMQGQLDRLGVPAATKLQVTESMKQSLERPNADVLPLYLMAIKPFAKPLPDSMDAMTAMSPTECEAIIKQLPLDLQPDVTLWLARHWARHRLYDEALAWLLPLQPEQVVDPASLLFFRAACQHALLQKDGATADLKRLLAGSDSLPIRYARMGTMMLADLQPLEPDSLDEISRLMNDVSRRLSLGRAGSKVSGQEQEVIDKLKKLIEQLEEQQQQQQQQQGGGSSDGSQRQSGSEPIDDARNIDQRGPGDVDHRDLGDSGDWGNLPPKERQATMQALGRALPSHYGEAIEAYFRSLANEGSTDE
jgi:hypothetical protein